MLGKKLFDPYGIESRHEEVEGLGLLDIETIFDRTKITAQADAEVRTLPWRTGQDPWIDGSKLKGYEIHMGRTSGAVGLFGVLRAPGPGDTREVLDGSAKGSVWGTYLHGIFDNDRFRRDLINSLRMKRGLGSGHDVIEYEKARDAALERWVAVLERHIDIQYIDKMIRGV